MLRREFWATSGALRFVLTTDGPEPQQWPARDIAPAPAVLWPQALRALVAQSSGAVRAQLCALVPAHMGACAPAAAEHVAHIVRGLSRELARNAHLALGMQRIVLAAAASAPALENTPQVSRAASTTRATSATRRAATRPLTSLTLRNRRGRALRLYVKLMSSEVGVVSYETAAHPQPRALGTQALSFALWEPPWPRNL